MTRWLAILFVAGLLLSVQAVAVAAPSATTISGGDMRRAVRLSAADEDAFGRSLSPPARVTPAPQPAGTGYSVTSPYWDKVLSAGTDRPAPEDVAIYYPQGGYVKARQSGSDVWLLLDSRQRALLDRYVRLGREGLLSEMPGAFEVVRASASRGEEVGITVGDRALDAAQSLAFWQVAGQAQYQPQKAATLPQDAPPPQMSAWLTFTLPEGRSLLLLWDADKGTLTDRFGEVYTVPRTWLQPVLGNEAVPGAGFDIAAVQVSQEDGNGSPAWWVVMIGGGAILLGAAVWLQRRWSKETR